MNLVIQFKSKSPVIQESVDFQSFADYYSAHVGDDTVYIQLMQDKGNFLHLTFSADHEASAAFILNEKYYRQREPIVGKTELLQACKRYFNGKYDYKIYYSFEYMEDQVFTFTIPAEIKPAVNLNPPQAPTKPSVIQSTPAKSVEKKPTNKQSKQAKRASQPKEVNKQIFPKRSQKKKIRKPIPPKPISDKDAKISLAQDFFRGIIFLIFIIWAFRSCVNF